MKKAMANPRVRRGVKPMPFDAQRMIYGGFDVLFEM
jgi:uncharacterized protein YbaA (DUF1428 family)